MTAHLLWACFVLMVAAAVVFVRRRIAKNLSDPAVRAVLDRLGDEVAVFDRDGAVVRSNSAWRRPGGEALSAAFEDQSLAGRWLGECLLTGRPVGGLLRKQGRLVTLGLSPLVDEFGDLLGGVAVVVPALAFEAKAEAAGLTGREFDLVLSVLQGRTYKEVSSALGISEVTVKSHLQNVYRKTGCHSRHELAAYFMPVP